ncbi:glycosyltransferase family 39 protein [Rufibacter glacialis]|uniref:Glycosyltransferase family 39 protein n=1 Tax=Rufibacter glacialis TaxID=1259555 RepID=A0A5M8QT00_9BACT|nr:glycosyltransferase family 39 protein [Rufibacter glacialis]KAA6437756.1 hypothetical protein FOE74_04445 [Rufibacter glacialis]GGK56564.1 hypothetical protein GCM10011405_00860 [Rufibacter glacialis]
MYLLSKVVAPILTKRPESVLRYGNSKSTTMRDLYMVFIIMAGILLRLFHYLDNRSLWLDELYLGISLIKMDFWELATQPLAYEQKAPLGYLWTVKFCVLLFGKGEMALRLFSLLSGIATLFVFVPVARYFLKPWAALVALALLALATPVVYHSVEAKQYATELLASVLALFFYLRYHRQTEIGPLLKWGVAGAVLLWFSYSVIFVLASLAITVSLDKILKRKWGRLFRYGWAFVPWLLSFGVIYGLFLGKTKDSAWLIHFFQHYYDAFLPLLPTSLNDLKWFPAKALSLLKNPMGQNALHLHWPYAYVLEHLRVVPFLLMVGGALLLAKKNRERFLVLVMPVLLVLFASGLKLYPFHERFLLFLFPMFTLLTCYGAQALNSFWGKRQKMPLVLGCLLLTPAVWNTVWEVYNPRLFTRKEASREALLFIQKNYQRGDVVYVYWNMRQAYAYYQEAYQLTFPVIQGKDVKNASATQTDYLKNLEPDFQQVKSHKRVLFLYNEYIKSDIGQFVGQPTWYFQSVPGKMLEPAFETLGKKLSQGFNAIGAVVSVYDVSPN